MNETLTNLLQQNRAGKVEGERGRGKKIPSGTFVNKEISQEEQQPGPPRQRNNLTESSNDEEGVDDTTCQICKSPWLELTKKCGGWIQMRYMR